MSGPARVTMVAVLGAGTIEQYVAAGRLGRKVGRGVYDYGA